MAGWLSLIYTAKSWLNESQEWFFFSLAQLLKIFYTLLHWQVSWRSGNDNTIYYLHEFLFIGEKKSQACQIKNKVVFFSSAFQLAFSPHFGPARLLLQAIDLLLYFHLGILNNGHVRYAIPKLSITSRALQFILTSTKTHQIYWVFQSISQYFNIVILYITVLFLVKSFIINNVS